MTHLKFTKMHGLGNDFMVIDGINQSFDPAQAPLTLWADRHLGIGFDQLLLVEASDSAADFRYRIFNADGSEVEQCGNGARCFVRFVSDKGLTDKREIVVETARGLIVPRLNDDGLVSVNMGQPRLSLPEIPFQPQAAGSHAGLLQTLNIHGEPVRFACVNMGNPHAVLQVADCERAPVNELGAQLESHPAFPERVNVGFMQVLAAQHIRLRVFERGVGETQACGTGACAAVVSGVRQGLLRAGEPVRVSLPGGDLYIAWQEGGDVLMTGPAVTVFEGELDY